MICFVVMVYSNCLPSGYQAGASCRHTWRRGWDSNPRYLAVSLVFKTSSINHSDTPPYVMDYCLPPSYISYYSI